MEPAGLWSPPEVPSSGDGGGKNAVIPSLSCEAMADILGNLLWTGEKNKQKKKKPTVKHDHGLHLEMYTELDLALTGKLVSPEQVGASRVALMLGHFPVSW